MSTTPESPCRDGFGSCGLSSDVSCLPSPRRYASRLRFRGWLRKPACRSARVAGPSRAARIFFKDSVHRNPVPHRSASHFREAGLKSELFLTAPKRCRHGAGGFDGRKVHRSWLRIPSPKSSPLPLPNPFADPLTPSNEPACSAPRPPRHIPWRLASDWNRSISIALGKPPRNALPPASRPSRQT